MALSDLPLIDAPSKNAEESENCVKQFLNQNTGFLCRNEVPDKGCDLDVELILDGKNTSGWKFAIQIKSCEELKIINDGTYISFSFKTSRLGYLLRRIPAYGYIMLYSVKEDKCYYDHVAKIYDRLMEERAADDWKDNEEINIHIPTLNILSENTAQEIHHSMSKVYQNATLLQNSWGKNYDLPTVSFNKEEDFDLRNPKNIVNFLSKYGMFLIRELDISKIAELLLTLPVYEIVSSKELLFISLITHSITGKNSEASYYARKCIRLINEYSEEQKNVIFYHKYKTSLALGEITSNDFVAFLREFEIATLDGHNRILVKINLIYFSLLSLKALQELPISIDIEIQEVFNLIDNSTLTERDKWLLRIWNCENFSYYAGFLTKERVSEIKIRESLGEVIPLDEKKEKVLEFISQQKIINKLLICAKDYGDKFNEPIVSAYSIIAYVRNAIQKEIDYLSFTEEHIIDDEKISYFDHLIKLSSAAGESFYNNRYLKEAHHCCCYALEIMNLARLGYECKVNFSVSDNVIKNNILALEKQLECEPYQSFFEALILNVNKRARIEGPIEMSFVKNLSNEQIDTLAKYSLKAFKLPDSRLINIINELHSYKIFFQRNKDSSIIPLQFLTGEQAKDNLYAEPIKFILRSTLTGLETIPSSDMNYLLSSWNL